jgi:hypothetical protein
MPWLSYQLTPTTPAWFTATVGIITAAPASSGAGRLSTLLIARGRDQFLPLSCELDRIT